MVFNRKAFTHIRTTRESKKGKRISDELIRSIEESKFYIIVFSKNYASSCWCLDELVKIMECHKTTDHTAYPVFYDVEPWEVRKQMGAVAEAFSKHENDGVAEKWREALKEAADLAGWELKKTADGHESKFIQKVVEELSLDLRSISFNIDEKLVGMESRIKELVSSLGTGSDDVLMIGIKGIGGGGKTTLARAIFDHISFQFEGKSFVEDVREVSKASFSGLKSLQNQVLSDVLNDKDISVRCVSEGKHMMKRTMCDKKVLVVLDDVDHIDQLEALAGEPDWFKKGSRIIITTRDEQVLIAHHVKSIHGVNLLSDMEAMSLFNRYAFGRKIPVQKYEELSRQVVHYAAGLPLTIKVLGSFLCGKDELEWIDALERLKTIPLTETLKKLELSYIALEEDYKEMFLDVACFMKGWRKDDAIKALVSCGFHARNGLKVLEQKSLITIYDSYYIYDDHKYVGMHDHIEEMGRNIVRRLHPDKPHFHTRLWIEEEIENVLANDLGTIATRCIRLDSQSYRWNMKGLRKMKELRFVTVEDQYHYGGYNEVVLEFPNALRYLRWDHFPYRSLPISFQVNNLVGLKMVGSEIIQLWEAGERKVLYKLRFLDLSRSMLSTLDLRLIPNLEILDLGSCSKLRTLDIGMNPNLRELDLENCPVLEELNMADECPKLTKLKISHSKLRTLNLGMTLNLETLHLGKCSHLVELHMPVKILKLKYINLEGSSLETLDLRPAPNLEKLILNFFNDLKQFRMASRCLNLPSLLLHDIGQTPNLKYSDLQRSFLEELDMADESQMLSYIEISGSKLRTLDIGLIPNLEYLNLRNCCNLEKIHMAGEFQKLANLYISSSKLRTLDIRHIPNLRKLDIVKSYYLEELKMAGESPTLTYIHISDSNLRTLDIGLTPNLEYLDLKNCYSLEEFHMAGKCEKLANLNISSSKLRTLDLGLTPNLRTLHFEECYNLVELRPPIGGLKKLEHLYLSSLRFRFFSFQMKNYTSLSFNESLEGGPLAELDLTVEPLESCPLHPDNNLPKFHFICHYKEDRPSSTGNLEMLISLGMCACTNLETFLESICSLRSLRKLKLQGRLLEVPKDLYKSECLEELILSSTDIQHLPDSMMF